MTATDTTTDLSFVTLRPLEFRPAMRLIQATNIGAVVAGLATAATELAVFAAWPTVLLPSFVQTGPRFWLAAVVVGLILFTAFGCVGARLDEEPRLALHPEQDIAPGRYFSEIGFRLLALAVVTTQPLWSAIGHAWTANTAAAVREIALPLLAHLTPSLALGLVYATIVAALSELRASAQHRQWATDLNDHATTDPADVAARVSVINPELDRVRAERAALWMITTRQARLIIRLRGELTELEPAAARLANERDDLAEALLCAEQNRGDV